jgi:hypothetical protein
MFNIAGAVIYLAVAALALRAALQSRSAGRPHAVCVHWRTVALLFAGLACWRLSGAEAAVQALARHIAQNTGSYASRREWQAPLVGLSLLAGAAFAVWAFLGPRGDPDVHWSRLAALGLVAYTAVRLVSLHAMDAIVYASVGPIHLNHFIDLGLTFTVAYFAVLSCAKHSARRRS